MSKQSEITYFAPAEKYDISVVRRQFEILDNNASAAIVLDATPYNAIVTNNARQVVFANRELYCLINKSQEDIIGLRPGEIFGCVNVEKAPNGCGTGKSCQYCGITGSMLKALESGKREIKEARLFVKENNKNHAYDFLVTSTPLYVEEEVFLLIYFDDISSRKKRERLERIFYHDVLNTAGGIKNLASYLSEAGDKKIKKITDLLVGQSELLIDEIRSQRLLVDAEANNLAVNVVSTQTFIIFNEARTAAESLKEAAGKRIISKSDSRGKTIKTDPTLLKRVLLNMLKNALEETEKGGSIEFLMEHTDDSVVYIVKNSKVMPENIKLQVFQRYFSTKGAGRGIGTYSMKLITENFLGGKVTMESEKKSGTLFRVEIPLNGVNKDFL